MKKIRRSKTIGANSILMLLAFFPPVQEMVAKHPDWAMFSLSAINILLRFVTKDQVRLEMPMFMKKKLVLLLLLLPSLACAASKGVARDMVEAPLTAGDVTAIVDCGTGPSVGFCHVRLVEGDTANRFITLIGPPAQCDREDACVFVKIYNGQGQVVWGEAFPKGQTEVKVDWKTLTGSDQIQVGHRGIWVVFQEVYFKNANGHDEASFAQADVVMRVHRKGYLPLDRVKEDPNFVWEWGTKSNLFKMTSSLRSYVGPK